MIDNLRSQFQAKLYQQFVVKHGYRTQDDVAIHAPSRPGFKSKVHGRMLSRPRRIATKGNPVVVAANNSVTWTLAQPTAAAFLTPPPQSSAWITWLVLGSGLSTVAILLATIVHLLG